MACNWLAGGGLTRRADIHNKHFGALGISLGAGIVLLAAAHEPALLATVAGRYQRANRLDAIDLSPAFYPAASALWASF